MADINLNHWGFSLLLSKKIQRLWLLAATLLLLSIVAAVPAVANVVVFDRIGLVDRPVILKVLTKGKWLPSGGQRVGLDLDGRALRPVLTGGDGYGYLEVHPSSAGLFKIRADFKGQPATARLLVVKPEDPLLGIGVVGPLRIHELSTKARAGSRRALEKLQSRYLIVYLVGQWGGFGTRRWLDANGFPTSVVLQSGSGNIFERLHERGIRLRALVASPSLLEAAAATVSRRFGFSPTDNGLVVENWQQIIDRLNEDAP